MGGSERPYLPALDGVRGLAALTVLLGHSPAWLFPWPHFAMTAVLIFFALSGFLITRILLDSKSKGEMLRHFYWRRSLRIFPIYFLTIAVAGWWAPRGMWLYAATYTLNFQDEFAYHLAHTWSLCVEEHFYLVWPFVVYFLSRERARLAAVAVVAIGVAFGLSFSWGWESNAEAVQGMMSRWTVAVMPALGAGALMAFHEANLRDRPVGAVYLGLGMLGAGLLVDHLQFVHPVVGDQWCLMFVGVGVFTMALGLAFLQGEAARWLAHPWLRYVGRISYGLYLFHFPIFIALRVYDTHEWWPVLAAWALSLALAAGSYRYFESKLLQFRHKLPGVLQPRAVPAPAPQAAPAPAPAPAQAPAAVLLGSSVMTN